MKKVIIIGSPGAGKTTFGKKLAATTNLPLYHLDYYYHDDRFHYKEDKPAWRQKVTELTDQSSWIIDGNYKSTLDIRFPKADTIIYLDYPRSLTLKRAIVRRIKLHGKVRDDMPSNWREQFTFELLKFIWSYNKIERPKVYKLLQNQKEHGQSIIIFTNSRQANDYLDEC